MKDTHTTQARLKNSTSTSHRPLLYKLNILKCFVVVTIWVCCLYACEKWWLGKYCTYELKFLDCIIFFNLRVVNIVILFFCLLIVVIIIEMFTTFLVFSADVVLIKSIKKFVRQYFKAFKSLFKTRTTG